MLLILCSLLLGHRCISDILQPVDPLARLHDLEEGVILVCLDEDEGIAQHQLDGMGYPVQVIVLEEFVPGLVHIQNLLCVSIVVEQMGLTLCVLEDLGVLLEQIHFDEDVLHPQVERIPPNIVQLVHVQPVDLIVDELEFPQSLLAPWSSRYQIDHTLQLPLLELQITVFVHHLLEYQDT